MERRDVTATGHRLNFKIRPRIAFAEGTLTRHIQGGWQMIAVGASRQRKVRTPQGSMPCRMRGGAGRKSGAMESVTENKPPAAQVAGKGEKAG